MRNVFLKSAKGFTLMEMLILLALLGSLLALAFPHVKSLVDQTDYQNCQSQLEQIRRAKSAYVVDRLGVASDGAIPVERAVRFDSTRSDDTDADKGVFRSYFPTRISFQCPRAKSVSTDLEKNYQETYNLFGETVCPWCASHAVP